MTAQRTLLLYAIWSANVAIALLAYGGYRLVRGSVAPQEWIYFLCVALFHAIFAIWFFKGRSLPAFQRATVAGRLATAALAGATAIFLLRGQSTSSLTGNALLCYAVATCFVDLISALWTRQLLADTGGTRRATISFEGKNRIAFGVYMIAIGSWLLFAPNSFLGFLHMPPTRFAGFAALDIGPIHVLGVQVLVLAAYNLVAARHDLKPLIDAGMHGGTLTAVAFIVLVAAGLVHPIALLLPAVDVVSIVLTALHRRGRGS